MKTFVAIALISTLLHTVSGIECFRCNSHKDGNGCKDPISKYKIDCGSDEDGKEYTLCRKIDMYIDMDVGKYHPMEERVHRDCAHKEDPDRECYYKSGYNTRSWVCHCREDGCNTAAHVTPTLVALLPIAAAAALRGMF